MMSPSEMAAHIRRDNGGANVYSAWFSFPSNEHASNAVAAFIVLAKNPANGIVNAVLDGSSQIVCVVMNAGAEESVAQGACNLGGDLSKKLSRLG